MKTKSIIISILLVLSCCTASAQSHNEEVTVEGTYRPQIKKSERLTKTPDMPKNEFKIPEYKIVTNDYDFNYRMDMETVSPLSYSTSEIKDIAGNFLMAGIGTRLSPVFLYRHHSELSKTMTLDAGVKHNSTWLDIKDLPTSDYMNNAFNVGMTNIFRSFQVRTTVDYHYDMYHLYGFDKDSVSYNNDDIKRKYNTLNVKSILSSNSTGFKSLHDEISLNYKYTGIPSSTQEHLFKVMLHVNHSNNWFGGDSGRQMLALNYDLSINDLETSLFLMGFNPYFDMRGDFYRIHVGLRFDIKTGVSEGFGLYPDIQGNLYVFQKRLEFYASLGGKTKINTFADIVAENPFINPESLIGDLGYEKTKIDFQAGVKAMITKGLDAHIGIRYRIIDNKMFYVPDYTVSTINTVSTPNIRGEVLNNSFSILYNGCNVFNFIADIHWKASEKLDFSTDITVSQYDMETSDGEKILHEPWPMTKYEYAWYQPDFEWNIRCGYQYGEKWKFKAAGYVLGTRYALMDDHLTVEKIEPAFDIKIGADYQYNKNLAFYGEITNLIHNKYQLYYNYPVYGFQVFVGFKYRFL